MLLSTPRLYLIFCALCVAWGAPIHAERKSAPIIGAAPPQPVEMNLKVHREAKTEITLRIYGKANEPLKYLIRVPPVHGRLSEPRATEREVSVVVYEPPADLGITADKFAYAVQNSIGVSAAVEVTLTIVDQPPQLAIQDTIDFSTVRAGASDSRLLEISNRGGLIANGEVIVDEPWKIEGKTGYHLRAGDVAVFKILFAPSVGGKFEGVARYTSDREHSTTLRGSAEAAIVANPEQWVLQQMPGDPVRSGAFELLNQLDEPRTLQLRTDARLKIPSEVTIPPHGKVSVPVEAFSQDVQAFDTEIHLEASDFATAVPVRVPLLQEVLRTTTPVVAFGRLAAGRKASATFDLENIGGTPGGASWEISPPFHVPVSSTVLEPGEKKVFHLEIDGKAPGHYRTWLQFKAGAQTFDLPVQGEVVASQRPSTGSSSAPAAPPPRTPQPGGANGDDRHGFHRGPPPGMERRPDVAQGGAGHPHHPDKRRHRMASQPFPWNHALPRGHAPA